MAKITKKELVANVAEISGLNKKDVEAVFKALPETIGTMLAEGKAEDKADSTTITIPGLGTFGTTYFKERVGVNPITREETVIPASYRVVFRASKQLKEKING